MNKLQKLWVGFLLFYVFTILSLLAVVEPIFRTVLLAIVISICLMGLLWAVIKIYEYLGEEQ